MKNHKLWHRMPEDPPQEEEEDNDAPEPTHPLGG